MDTHKKSNYLSTHKKHMNKEISIFVLNAKKKRRNNVLEVRDEQHLKKHVGQRVPFRRLVLI